MIVGADRLGRHITKGFTPPERMGLVEFCDRYRIIPPGKPGSGRWKTSRVLPWTFIYNMYTDPRVREIVVEGGSQIAKSETQTNVSCFHMMIDRKPILMIKSSINNLKSYVKDSLDPTIAVMPELRKLVREDPEGREKSDSVNHKRFGGEWMYVGPPTLNSLCERAAGVGLADEVSLWPRDIGGEGDGYYLLKKRLSNYYDHKLMAVSKPAMWGCQISTLYNERKRHVWHWRCPERRWGEQNAGCGRLFEFDFMEQSGCDDHNPMLSWVRCPHCEYQIREDRRIEASFSGEWICLDPDRPMSALSFQMSGLMFEWVTFSSAIEDLLRAEGDPTRLKTFTNQILGLPFRPGVAKKASSIILKERNVWNPRQGAIPKEAPLLTCAVDIQEKGFAVMQWIAWAQNLTGYSVHGEKMGGLRPDQLVFWEELGRRLKRKFPHEAGCEIDAEAVIIDTGHRATEAYRFLKSVEHEETLFVGWKGEPGWSRPLWEPMKGRVGVGVTLGNLFRFATWDLQKEIYEKYLIKEDEPGRILFPTASLGPGNPDYLSDRFFSDLTAYSLLEKTLKSGEISHEWRVGKKEHDFNDTVKMSWGLAKFLNPVWEEINDALLRMAQERRGEVVSSEEEPEETEEDYREESFMLGCF